MPLEVYDDIRLYSDTPLTVNSALTKQTFGGVGEQFYGITPHSKPGRDGSESIQLLNYNGREAAFLMKFWDDAGVRPTNNAGALATSPASEFCNCIALNDAVLFKAVFLRSSEFLLAVGLHCLDGKWAHCNVKHHARFAASLSGGNLADSTHQEIISGMITATSPSMMVDTTMVYGDGRDAPAYYVLISSEGVSPALPNISSFKITLAPASPAASAAVEQEWSADGPGVKSLAIVERLI